MNEMVFESFEDILNKNKDIISIEMGCGEVSLLCTTGKIKAWFGRQVSSEIVKEVLKSFARIDSSVIHETEIVCDYDTIASYENYDYILISYGKTQGGYRAQFNIPLVKEIALYHLINSAIKELEEAEINKSFNWNGSIASIELIYNELRSLDDWNITNVEYREEE